MKKLIFLFLVTIIKFSIAQTYSAMSYNIRYSNNHDGENNWESRKGAVCDLVDYYSPDIIGIQEGLVSQLNNLKICLPCYDYFGVGREDGKKQGEFTAILYNTNKFSLIKAFTIWLSPKKHSISTAWDAALPRTATFVLLKSEKNQQKLWVINTHFDHKGIKAREESAKLILDEIQKVNKTNLPIILTGDLNATRNSVPVNYIEKHLKNSIESSRKKHYGPLGTFNRFDKDAELSSPIDFIFTHKIKVLSHRHIDDRREKNLWVSDHLPVFIKFSF